jgi:hypothetical protein
MLTAAQRAPHGQCVRRVLGFQGSHFFSFPSALATFCRAVPLQVYFRKGQREMFEKRMEAGAQIVHPDQHNVQLPAGVTWGPHTVLFKLQTTPPLYPKFKLIGVSSC